MNNFDPSTAILLSFELKKIKEELFPVFDKLKANGISNDYIRAIICDSFRQAGGNQDHLVDVMIKEWESIK